MRDSFPPPQDERHTPQYERLYLEAPAPPSLEPLPKQAHEESDGEDEDRQHVIIIEM